MVSFNASLSIARKWRLIKGLVKLGISYIKTMEPGIASPRAMLAKVSVVGCKILIGIIGERDP